MMNFSKMIASKTAPGILLCVSGLLAIIFANTPLSGIYAGFKSVPVVLQVGDFRALLKTQIFATRGLRGRYVGCVFADYSSVFCDCRFKRPVFCF